MRQRSIGNDIIDLSWAEPPLHPRYVERVFTETEQKEIGQDQELLWSYWAAKESAFKALARLDPSIAFSQRDFEYHPERHIIKYKELELACELRLADDCISAKAALNCEISSLYHLTEKINSGSETTSSAVRELARIKIASILDLDSKRISLSPPSKSTSNEAPQVYLDGEKLDWLISFAHHGQAIGFAYFRDTTG